MTFNLFLNGWCRVSDIDEFLFSEVGIYLSKVYGNLVYSEKPRPNFLNVHKEDKHLIISEGVFYDKFPHEDYVGSIVPLSLNCDVEENQRGGDSVLGKLVSNIGYSSYYTDISDSLVETICSMPYADSPEAADKKYKRPQIPLEFFTYKEMGIDFPHIPMLSSFVEKTKELISDSFHGNYLFSSSNNEQAHIQKMTNGLFMPRHFDSDINGNDNYILSYITWVTDGYFEGRDLVCGRRSNIDLANWVTDASNGIRPDGYKSEPANFKDTASFRPETRKAVLINSFNPKFYHGVTKLTGPGSVYTILNDFRPQ